MEADVLGEEFFRRMSTGTAAPDEGCVTCYVNGVICALVGASLQAVGLQFWKLHFMREEQRLSQEDHDRAIEERLVEEEHLSKVLFPVAQEKSDKDMIDKQHTSEQTSGQMNKSMQRGGIKAGSEDESSLDFCDVALSFEEPRKSDTSFRRGHSDSFPRQDSFTRSQSHSHHVRHPSFAASVRSEHSGTSGSNGMEKPALPKNTVTFHQVIRHVRNRSGHSVMSIMSQHSNDSKNSQTFEHFPSNASKGEGMCTAERVDKQASLHGERKGALSDEDASRDRCLVCITCGLDDKCPSFLPRCLWWVGFFVFLVGNVLDFIALGLTKVSIVTLVGSGSLVVNTVMARLLLKETVTRLDIAAALLIMLGIGLTVVGNQSPVRDWTIKQLVAQYQRADVVVMLIIFACIIAGFFFLMGSDHLRRKALALTTGQPMLRPPRFICAITCVVGAIVATFTILFGKAFSGLILLTFGGENQFTDVFTVVIVVVFLVSLPSQLVLINMSLALNDALMHIPNFYVFWNLGSIISGAIFYQELAELTSKDIAIFFSGVVVLIIAVTLTNISGARKQRAADQAAAAAEAEKAAALEAAGRAQSAEGRGEADAGSLAEAVDTNPAGVDFLGGGWLEPGGGAQGGGGAASQLMQQQQGLQGYRAVGQEQQAQAFKSRGAAALAAATGEREGGESRAGAVDLGQGSLITSQIPPLNRYLSDVPEDAEKYARRSHSGDSAVWNYGWVSPAASWDGRGPIHTLIEPYSSRHHAIDPISEKGESSLLVSRGDGSSVPSPLLSAASIPRESSQHSFPPPSPSYIEAQPSLMSSARLLPAGLPQDQNAGGGWLQVVQMHLRLAMDFQAAGQEDTFQRQMFIKDLKQDLAYAAGAPAADFNILKVAAGSILVDMHAPEKAAQEIQRQSVDANSRLRSGKVTRFTESIILATPRGMQHASVTLAHNAPPRTQQSVSSHMHGASRSTLSSGPHLQYVPNLQMYTSPPPSCAPELGQHTLLHVSHTAHAAHAPRDPADSKKAQQPGLHPMYPLSALHHSPNALGPVAYPDLQAAERYSPAGVLRDIGVYRHPQADARYASPHMLQAAGAAAYVAGGQRETAASYPYAAAVERDKRLQKDAAQHAPHGYRAIGQEHHLQHLQQHRNTTPDASVESRERFRRPPPLQVVPSHNARFENAFAPAGYLHHEHHAAVYGGGGWGEGGRGGEAGGGRGGGGDASPQSRMSPLHSPINEARDIINSLQNLLRGESELRGGEGHNNKGSC